MTVDSTVKSQVGQLLMCGFHGLEPTPGIIDLIENHNLGSVILFSRNIESPEQVQRLTHQLQTIAHKAGHARPLFIAVDQENGVVRRLGHSGTYLPGNMGLGALDSSTDAYSVARATAKELLALGINWNLAPVLDVNNNPLNPVIGVRSFGQDPHQVARLGLAQTEGYHHGKVATSVKHFPGHGDTATDSHLGVPIIEKTIDELAQVELVPFQRSFDVPSDAPAYPTSVMIAHMSLPHIIPEPGLVSSLASSVVRDLLRTSMGYQGIIITDCLEMEAVKDTVGTAQAALVALQAGNDMAMISHTYEYQRDAFTKIADALHAKKLDEAALEASFRRVAELKERFLSWEDVLDKKPLDTVGAPEHKRLSEDLYDRIPTVVRDRTQLLPLQLKKEERVLFLAAHVPTTLAVDSEKEPFNSFNASLTRRHANVKYVIYNENTPDMTREIADADLVLLGTANANLYPFQVDMVKHAHKHAKKLLVAAVMNPYDLMEFPDVNTYLVTYEYTPAAHEAAVRVMFGETNARSHLPVTIPNVGDAIQPTRPLLTTYREATDAQSVHGLWMQIFDKTFPLALDKLHLILNTTMEGMHLVARDPQGNIIGFVATQIRRETPDRSGELMLLMVSPAHRRRGVGTRLHDAALEHLRQQGVKRLQLGASYPRFFPGVPESADAGFFERRGWQAGTCVHDLEHDALQQYKTSASLAQRMANEQVWFGRIRPSELWELYAFQQRYFPYWKSTYQHHAELGDYQDLIVARQGNAQGPIIGSLVLNTTYISHERRSDLVWTEAALFGTKSGGMACVGIAEEQRGRKLGLGLVDYAHQVLQRRGVEKSYVDWVEAVAFYDHAGYHIWRSYRMYSM